MSPAINGSLVKSLALEVRATGVKAATKSLGELGGVPAAKVTRPLSIVTGKLKPIGPTQVTKRYRELAAEEMKLLEQDIKSCGEMLKETPNDIVTKSLYDNFKRQLDALRARTSKVVRTVREYVDSKGAKYVETIEKDGSSYGTGTPVRKLEKLEESFMPDGRKIRTKTTHDKSDMLLLGEGHQDGRIIKVEEIVTKDGVTVGRRTTTQQASGYGGKTIEKEASLDGQELNVHNTKRTSSYLDSNGIKTDKTTYEPGIYWFDHGYQMHCNEHGIPQMVKDSIKPGW